MFCNRTNTAPNTIRIARIKGIQSGIDITFVELPKIGEELKQSAHCATVESVKAASDVYAPLSGKVLRVNMQLATNPELINQSAYEKGFFFSMEIINETEKLNLMNASSYQSYLEGISK